MTLIRGRGGSGASAVSGGSGTITAGQTSVNITHTLGGIPTWVTLAPTNSYAVGGQVTAKAANTFTVSIDAPQPVDATFDYALAL